MRQDGRGKERRVEEAEGEEDEGVVAGQRAHGFGSVRGNLDGAHAVHVERGRAGHDDEPGDEIGEEAAYDDIEARGGVVLDANSLLHDRRLQIELHPWGDGGADDADGHVHVCLVAPDGVGGQLDGGQERVVPAGLREHAGKDVGDIDDGGDEEDFFRAFVVAANDQEPDQRRAQTGTEMNLVTWNRCSEPAMPMNSVTTLV